jgi:hypothetical protein
MPQDSHVPIVTVAVTHTNVPAALTEVAGVYRIRIDLSGLTWVRCGARVQLGVTGGGTIKVQYSLNESSWADLCSGVSLAATGTPVSAWELIPDAAKTDSQGFWNSAYGCRARYG